MTTDQLKISIVTPMHNEEECIREFHRRVTDVLRNRGESYEIIMVDDGSTDSTTDIMHELCGADPHMTGVFLSRNRGQCTAIYAGLQHSRGKSVVVMDGDLQHKPEELPLLLDEMKNGWDMVKGCRTNRGESYLLRRFPSKAANYLMRACSGCSVHDMGGFSCIRGDIARKLHLRAGQHRLLPALVHLMGGSVTEVDTSAPPRFAGNSHYGIGRSVDVLFDIIMLWFQSSFKQRPVYLFGRVSLVLFGLATLTCLWLLYEKIFFGEPMGTRPPFFGAVLFYIASMGFMATGFIMEMIAGVYDSAARNRPYVVREVIRDGKSDLD